MSLALIIDDEADLCRLMQMTLKKMHIDSMVAYDLATARDCLSEHHFDFCLTDLRLPDGSGIDIVKIINQKYPLTPVAVITAHGNMDLAIEALKLGAFDFVNKPLELPRLRQLVENALKAGEDAKQTAIEEDDPFNNKLIGQSAPIQSLKATIQKLARSQAPVFLWGESGTGKEVVAKLIHELSPRAHASFVPVNCGAIPSELMESEFFGHKKGSFTGATSDKEGLFQQANGGTLFLDEVADLPLPMQVKLLRAIQEKKVRPIGGTQEIAVDIRLLSATHKNLAKLVEAGEFRQDLYYRINVIEVKLPSLNERKEDILLLANHFLNLIAQDWGLEHTPTLTPEACVALSHHHFLGNVRELRNVLERAITLSDGTVIEVSHLNLPHQTNNIATQSNETSHISLGTDSSNKTIDLSGVGVDPIIFYDETGSDTIVQDDTIESPINNVTNSAFNKGVFGSNVLVQPSVNISTTPLAPKATNIIQTLPSISASVMGDLSKNTASSHKTSNYDSNFTILPEEGLEEYLLNQERQLIIAALNQSGWNKTKAAKLLNTTFRSLRYRMKKLEIDSDDD